MRRFLIFSMCLLMLATFAAAGVKYNDDVGEYGQYETTDWIFFKKYDLGLTKVDVSIIDFEIEGYVVSYSDNQKVFNKMFYKDTKGNSKEFKEDYTLYINNTVEWFEGIDDWEVDQCWEVWLEEDQVMGEDCNYTETPTVWITHTREEWLEVPMDYKFDEGEYKYKIEGKRPNNKVLDMMFDINDNGNSAITNEWVWFNATWKYRKNVSNLTGEYPTVNITMADCNNNCNDDFSDLRFLSQDSSTELNYTFRNGSLGNWQSLTIDTNNVSWVYMYYNNLSVITTTEDINDTFLFPLSAHYLSDLQDSANGYDLTKGNTPSLTTDCWIGSCYDFTETNFDYLTTTSYKTVPWNQDWTQMSWVKIESFEGSAPQKGIISMGSDNTGDFVLNINNDDGAGEHQFMTQIGGDPATPKYVFSTDRDSYVGEWIFLSSTYDGTAKKNRFYMNNTLIGQSDAIGSTPNSGSQFVIGASINSGSPSNIRATDGIIDEVMVWNYQLTAHQIAEFYSMQERDAVYGVQESTNEPPEVDLLSPVNDTFVDANGISIDFICNATDIEQLDNVTFQIWNVSDGSLFDSQINTSGLDGNYTFSQVVTYSNYTWNCLAIDNSSVSASAPKNFTLNIIPVPNEAPVVNLVSPANDTSINSNSVTVDFVCNASDKENLDNVTYRIWNVTSGLLYASQTNTSGINNTDYTFSQNVMFANYTWNCEATDNQSSSTFTDVNWTINIIPIPDNAPTVTQNSPDNNSIYLTSPKSIDFNCSAYDEVQLSNVSLYIDDTITLTNSSGINDTDYIFTPAAFNDGTYTWKCGAVDNVSQETLTANRNFIIDSAVPVVNITAPEQGFLVTELNETINLNWTAEDANIDKCWYNIGSGDTFVACGLNTTTFDYPEATPNSLTINFTANDTLGNISSDQVTIYKSNVTPVVNITAPDEGFEVTAPGETITLNWTATTVGTLSKCWYDIGASDIFVSCGAGTTTFIYPAANPDNLIINFTSNDTIGNQASDQNTINKSTNAPDINLTSPTGSTLKIVKGESLNLNWTITNVTAVDSCWYSYNGTNTTVTCGDETDTFVYANGVKTLTFYSNDTLSNVNSTTTTWTVRYFEKGADYTGTVFEGSTQNFNLNITVGVGESVAEAHLIYGTTVNDTSSLSISGTDFVISNSIEIPDVVSEENVSFYWEVILSNPTLINSSTFNQTVQPINIDNCSNFTVVAYNLTLYDEQTRKFLVPGANLSTFIEVDLDIASELGSPPFLTFSQDFNNTNSAQVCLDQNLTSSGYVASIQIRYGATSRSTELYHIDNDVLSSATIPKEVGLYPLNDSFATTFDIVYTGPDFLTVNDAIIQIKRKYIGSGEFITVEAPKTDNDGEAVGHFQIENVVYLVTVIKNGTILATFDNIVLRCQNPLTGECSLQLSAFESGSKFEDWNTIGDLLYTVVQNDDLRTIIVQFNTVSGTARTVRFIGKKFDGVGNVTVCDESLFSSAGTLTCNVNSTFGNVTIITELFSNGDKVTTAIFSFNQSLKDALGNDAYVFAIILMMILPLLFIQSTVGMVLAGIMGMLMSITILLIESTTIFAKGAAFTWLIIAGIIIIWKLSKRETI